MPDRKSGEPQLSTPTERALYQDCEHYTEQIKQMHTVGDYMQSEASRLAEFVSDLPADYPIPYEVRQALFGVSRGIRQWTDLRRGTCR